MTQIERLRNEEFYKLFDSRDLLPFYKLKGFWAKISLVFLSVNDLVVDIVSAFSLSNILIPISGPMKFVQGLYPF
jgi:hypothetical protein